MKVSIAIAVLATTAIGCATQADSGPDQAEAQSAALTTGRTVVEAGGVVATFRTAMVAGLEDAEPRPTGTVRERIEAAITALVAAADCVSVRWALSTATVRFDDCRIPTTDEQLDGVLRIRVRPLDRSVELTLDHLTIGPDAFDGTVRAYVRGPVGATTLGIDAELTLARDAATLRVVGLALEASVDGVTVSGNGEVVSPEVDASATAHQLHWVLGDCLPSNGSVAFDDGRVDGVITFLATTPATGEVELDLGRLPPVIVSGFPVCQ